MMAECANVGRYEGLQQICNLLRGCQRERESSSSHCCCHSNQMWKPVIVPLPSPHLPLHLRLSAPTSSLHNWGSCDHAASHSFHLPPREVILIILKYVSNPAQDPREYFSGLLTEEKNHHSDQFHTGHGECTPGRETETSLTKELFRMMWGYNGEDPWKPQPCSSTGQGCSFWTANCS